MGKGGGKCASRDQSASSSRTPRLPAPRSRKASIEASSQASKPSSRKEKVTGSDPTTLVPLIPKEDRKEVLSSSHTKLDDDDGIDTNVTFDQDVDYSASDSRRRLTSVSSSEMPSVYNTANVSPARSFSSGGRSPDTLYLSGSEDLPSYKASPVRPVGMPLPPKHLKAGLSSPDPLVYNPSNDDDLYLAKGAPAPSSSGVVGSRGGGLRKRHSIAASSSTVPFEARSLTTSSSFPAPSGRAEEKPLQRNLGQTTEEAIPLGESESTEAIGHSIAVVPVAIEDDPKSSSPHKAEASSKETLDDNWEMVSPVHQQSKGLSPEWVSVPKPNVPDKPLQVALVQGNNKVVGSQQVGEGAIVEPVGESVVEPFGLSSKAMPVIPIAKSNIQSNKALKTSDEEAETVKSVDNDQFDDIETRLINGDGGDYVLLGTSQNPPSTERFERGSPQGINILPLPRKLQEEQKSEEQLHGLSLEQSIQPMDEITSRQTIKAPIDDEIKELKIEPQVGVEDKAQAPQDTHVKHPLDVSQSLLGKDPLIVEEKALPLMTHLLESNTQTLPKDVPDDSPNDKILAPIPQTMIATSIDNQTTTRENNSKFIDSRNLNTKSPIKEDLKNQEPSPLEVPIPSVPRKQVEGFDEVEEPPHLPVVEDKEAPSPVVEHEDVATPHEEELAPTPTVEEKGLPSTVAPQEVPPTEEEPPVASSVEDKEVSIPIEVEDAALGVDVLEEPTHFAICEDKEACGHVEGHVEVTTFDSKDLVVSTSLDHDGMGIFDVNLLRSFGLGLRLILLSRLVSTSVSGLNVEREDGEGLELPVAFGEGLVSEASVEGGIGQGSRSMSGGDLRAPVGQDPSVFVGDVSFPTVLEGNVDSVPVLYSSSSAKGSSSSSPIIDEETLKSNDNSWRLYKKKLLNDVVFASQATPIAIASTSSDGSTELGEGKEMLASFAKELSTLSRKAPIIGHSSLVVEEKNELEPTEEDATPIQVEKELPSSIENRVALVAKEALMESIGASTLEEKDVPASPIGQEVSIEEEGVSTLSKERAIKGTFDLDVEEDLSIPMDTTMSSLVEESTVANLASPIVEEKELPESGIVEEDASPIGAKGGASILEEIEFPAKIVGKELVSIVDKVATPIVIVIEEEACPIGVDIKATPTSIFEEKESAPVSIVEETDPFLAIKHIQEATSMQVVEEEVALVPIVEKDSTPSHVVEKECGPTSTEDEDEATIGVSIIEDKELVPTPISIIDKDDTPSYAIKEKRVPALIIEEESNPTKDEDEAIVVASIVEEKEPILALVPMVEKVGTTSNEKEDLVPFNEVGTILFKEKKVPIPIVEQKAAPSPIVEEIVNEGLRPKVVGEDEAPFGKDNVGELSMCASNEVAPLFGDKPKVTSTPKQSFPTKKITTPSEEAITTTSSNAKAPELVPYSLPLEFTIEDLNVPIDKVSTTIEAFPTKVPSPLMVDTSIVNPKQVESDFQGIGEKIDPIGCVEAKKKVENSWRDFIEEMENESIAPTFAAPIA